MGNKVKKHSLNCINNNLGNAFVDCITTRNRPEILNPGRISNIRG